jgi:hypothetical protein
VSATGRSDEDVRQADDAYETPGWCVERLLEACPLPGGLWLEPCAGTGAIIRAVQAVRKDVRWWAIEKRPEVYPALYDLVVGGPGGGANHVAIGDYLADRPVPDPALVPVVITNPPFFIAQQVIEQSLKLGRTVVMLLRLNYLASEARSEFMRANIPDWYVLPNRPSFVAVTRAVWACTRPRKRCKWSCQRPLDEAAVPRCQKCGGLCERKGTRTTTSDATEYAWAVWPPERGRRQGLIEVLATTPEEVRLAARRERQRAA